MSRNQAENSKKKPVIIVVSFLLVAVVIFISAFGFADKKEKKAESEKSSTTSSASGSPVSVTLATGSNNAVAAPGRDETPQAISTTAAADRKDGSALPEGTASQFIKGAEATNRWEASSIISTVTVERVRVKLNEYEKGKKTDIIKTRYLYAAEVETRPSRINMISANQVTPDRIAGIPAIVKGYESKKNEELIFACSNEFCARDNTNPNGNIYYTSSEALEATVVKDSVLAQQGKPSTSLGISENGKWEYPLRISLSNSSDLIKLGLKNSVSYTCPVIWEGKKYKKEETDAAYDIWNDRIIAPPGDVSSDRTVIGKTDENHYVFLISEGFSGGYLADYMLKDMGAKYAYWGAGGYATGMYVKGYGVINSNNYIAHGDLFCIK